MAKQNETREEKMARRLAKKWVPALRARECYHAGRARGQEWRAATRAAVP